MAAMHILQSNLPHNIALKDISHGATERLKQQHCKGKQLRNIIDPHKSDHKQVLVWNPIAGFFLAWSVRPLPIHPCSSQAIPLAARLSRLRAPA